MTPTPSGGSWESVLATGGSGVSWTSRHWVSEGRRHLPKAEPGLTHLRACTLPHTQRPHGTRRPLGQRCHEGAGKSWLLLPVWVWVWALAPVPPPSAPPPPHYLLGLPSSLPILHPFPPPWPGICHKVSSGPPVSAKPLGLPRLPPVPWADPSPHGPAWDLPVLTVCLHPRPLPPCSSLPPHLL